jgi:hypothetical protein
LVIQKCRKLSKTSGKVFQKRRNFFPKCRKFFKTSGKAYPIICLNDRDCFSKDRRLYNLKFVTHAASIVDLKVVVVSS